MSLLAVGKVRAHLSRNFSILPLVHIDPSWLTSRSNKSSYTCRLENKQI
jgi:hypothetical protein